jgi:hypothetical protein
MYSTIASPAALYGCGTSSLALRKEPRLRELENRALKKILVLRPKRDEVTEEWRRLHNEELQDPYQILFGRLNEKE